MNELSALKNMNALYLEDDLMAREQYERIFNNFFKEVYVGSNGTEGLEIFSKHPINIIISDIKMPDMNGIEFIQKIRMIDENIPILVTSAYTDKDDLLAAVKFNLVDYLIKPISFDAIKEVLTKCIKRCKNFNRLEIVIDDNLIYNFEKKIIQNNSKEIVLPNKESRLLELFLQNRGKVISKNWIEAEVYDDEFMSESAFKNLLLKLRKKLNSSHIKTLKNSGYIFE